MRNLSANSVIVVDWRRVSSARAHIGVLVSGRVIRRLDNAEDTDELGLLLMTDFTFLSYLFFKNIPRLS